MIYKHSMKSLNETVKDVALNTASLFALSQVGLDSGIQGVFGSGNQFSTALGQSAVVQATRFGKNVLASTAGIGNADVRPIDQMIVDYLADAGGLWAMDATGMNDFIDRSFGVSGVGGSLGGAVTIEALDALVGYAKKTGVLKKVESTIQGVF